MSGHGHDASCTEGATAVALDEREVLRCLPGLRAMLLRMTRDPQLAEDLSQDVVFRVIQAVRAGRLRDPGALLAYVHQSARNAVGVHGRQPQPQLYAEPPERETLWAPCPPSPLEQCEVGELRELAIKVLGELPCERDRQILTAHYVEDLAKSDLLARFALSSEQFDHVISRARRRMRELLLARLNRDQQPVRGSSACGISETGHHKESPQ